MSYFNPQAGETHAEVLRKKKIAQRLASQAGGVPGSIGEGIYSLSAAIASRIAASKAAQMEAEGIAGANAGALDIISRSVPGGEGGGGGGADVDIDETTTGSTSSGSAKAEGSAKPVSGDVYTGFMSHVAKSGLKNPYGLAAVAATGERESRWSKKNLLRTWNDVGKPAGGALSWRDDRLRKMVRHVKNSGMDPVTGQADFFVAEAKATGLWNELANAKSAAEANAAMARHWRYKGYNGGTESKIRLKKTNQYLKQITNFLNPVGSAQAAEGGGAGVPIPTPRPTMVSGPAVNPRFAGGQSAAAFGPPAEQVMPGLNYPRPGNVAIPGMHPNSAPVPQPVPNPGLSNYPPPGTVPVGPRLPGISPAIPGGGGPPGGIHPLMAGGQSPAGRGITQQLPGLNFPNPGGMPMPSELMPPAPLVAPHGPPGRAPAGFPPFDQPHGPPMRMAPSAQAPTQVMPPLDYPYPGGVAPQVPPPAPEAPIPTPRPAAMGGGGPSGAMISSVPRPRVTARGMLDVNDAPLPGTMPFRGGSGGGAGAPIGGGRFNPFGLFGNRAGRQPRPGMPVNQVGMTPGVAGATAGAAGANAVNGIDMDLVEAIGNPFTSDGHKAVLTRILDSQLKSVFDQDLPSIAQEYEYARRNGFEGTFMEYVQVKGKSNSTNINNVVGGERLTPGWKKIDEAFAEEWLKWGTGGAADAQKRLQQLNEALAILESGEDVTGKIGLLPDIMKPFFNERGTIARENVEEVVQRNLREVLGAQFTEKEGERLIQRAFNDLLPPPENAKRVRRLIAQIAAAAAAKDAMVRHFAERGTLMGYEGPTTASYEGQLSSLANEWERADAKFGGTQKATLPRVGDIIEGYRFKGGNPNNKANWEKVR